MMDVLRARVPGAATGTGSDRSFEAHCMICIDKLIQCQTATDRSYYVQLKGTAQWQALAVLAGSGCGSLQLEVQENKHHCYTGTTLAAWH